MPRFAPSSVARWSKSTSTPVRRYVRARCWAASPFWCGRANRRLARNIQADDRLVGQRFVSSAVEQYAKNPGRRELTEIVDELFDAHGGDMYFETAEDYVPLGAPVSFATVVAAASRRQETAIGYRVADDRLADERNYGVHLNPPKSQRRVYRPGDQIIVIALRHVRGPARAAVQRGLDEPAASALVDGR